MRRCLEKWQSAVQGTGKADWQVFSDGTEPPAQAGTIEEVGNKKRRV